MRNFRRLIGRHRGLDSKARLSSPGVPFALIKIARLLLRMARYLKNSFITPCNWYELLSNVYIGKLGKLRNARSALSTVCLSLPRLGKRDSLLSRRVLIGHDDSSLYPWLQGVLIALSPFLLSRLFCETVESIAIVVSLPGAELGSTAKSVVYSGTHISACVSIVPVGKRRATLRGGTRTHARTYRCTHERTNIYTYTYACTLPKDSKRQMLKRPMETGHVDVAADAPHRTVAQHESL